MAFKLSNEALEDILGHRDYTLAYNDELKRLHVELENPVYDLAQTNTLRGEVLMLRKLMGLHEKALEQMEAEHTRRHRASV